MKEQSTWICRVGRNQNSHFKHSGKGKCPQSIFHYPFGGHDGENDHDLGVLIQVVGIFIPFDVIVGELEEG